VDGKNFFPVTKVASTINKIYTYYMD